MRTDLVRPAWMLHVSPAACPETLHSLPVQEGFYNLWNWFDDKTWYPLGRVIGGTVYPVSSRSRAISSGNSTAATDRQQG